MVPSPVGVEGTDKVEGFKYEVMALNEDGAGIHGTGNFKSCLLIKSLSPQVINQMLVL